MAMDEGLAVETKTASEDPEAIEAMMLSQLRVHFISLVESPANKRQFLVKQAAHEDGVEIVEKTVRIAKNDSKRRVAYGIVLAPDEVDDEQDTISAEEIEKAAYGFMQAGRSQQVDSDHDGDAGKGFVAESWLVRSGDPLFAEEPDGAWAVGIKVTDAETWDRVEKGELTGFSVAGLARRTPVELENTSEEGAMAEQVEKGRSTETVEPVGTDVAEDLDAAAEGFVSRVVSGLKRHFGGDGNTVEKAGETLGGTIRALREKKDWTIVEAAAKMSGPGSRDDSTWGQIERGEITEPPDEVLAEIARVLGGSARTLRRLRDAGAGEVKKDLPGEQAVEPVEKGFKEKMLRQQLWSITSALSDAVRDVLQDDEVKDKVAGVRMVVQEFQDWLEEQVGAAVSKGEGERVKGEEDKPAAVVKEDRQDEPLAAVQQTLEDLSARLETVEKQHPGRQTDLGGDDAEPVQKADGKGYRGLPISI